MSPLAPSLLAALRPASFWGSGPFEEWGPLALTFLVVGVLLWATQRPLKPGDVGHRVKIFYRQLIFILLLLISAIALIYASPMLPGARAELLNFFGIILSGAIALSSTTFLGNIMAGFMLRSLRNFKPGDYLRVGEHFGRVTESGLFHVEIQTEDRDLTTLPNMFLIVRPMEVVRASGTIVSADVSIGYDVHRGRVKELLLEAGSGIGLVEPFVRILKLGDYSVEYKLGGLLLEVDGFLSTHTKLRGAMLDALHAGGVEIASPTILSTRRFGSGDPFVPSAEPPSPLAGEEVESSFESLAFDKANRAGVLELMREDLLGLEVQVQQLTEQRAKTKDKHERAPLERELESLQSRAAAIQGQIHAREASNDQED